MIKIGADPEFFVQKRRHFFPPHNLPFGTKAEPMPTEHGAIQIDGLALECNVNPAATRDEFVSNVRGVITDLSRHLYDYEPMAKIVARPSVFFGHKRLSQLPIHATELGCTPDYDAYTGERNPTPPANAPFRTGAGHLHISWTENEDVRKKTHMTLCSSIVKELDYFLGLPSLLWDNDSRRRALYGRAGAFRPKSYGVEYRVLSNKWCSTDSLIGWVFDRAKLAVENVIAAQRTRLSDVYGDVAKNMINSGDVYWRQAFPDLAAQVLQ